MSTDFYQNVVLHEVPRPVVQHDIFAFLRDTLIEIRDEYNLEPVGSSLTDQWPGSQMLQVLTDMAVPLFIVAATICRLIRDADRPEEGLQTILQSRNSGRLSDMGQVYRVVLQATTASTRDELSKEKLYREFRKIVGTIISLAEPLSRIALANLLDMSSGDVQLRLRSLHAVIHMPLEGDALIRPLHLSFGEYLTSPELQNDPFSVNAVATHRMLWGQCLRLLCGPNGLRENVCDLSYPGQLRCEVSPAQVAKHLSPEVCYACRYWVNHVQSGAFQLSDGDEIHIFLQNHFLHWLEVLSFLDRLADAIEFVKLLQSKLAVSKLWD